MEFIRFLLFPFAFLYALITIVRNKLYDRRLLNSIQFDLPVISIGNLSVGGTGKTPHVEYLIRLLHEKFYVSVLSRGYMRKSTGYIVADFNSTAEDIGDEPRQFRQRFHDITVAVAENRMLAIPQLLSDAPQTDVLLLDDAFQHRSVIPGLSILLTDFNQLFTKDYILPVGRLREPRSSYKRADIIIVTKCPPELSIQQRKAIAEEIKPLPHQQLFFSFVRYHHPYATFNVQQQIALSSDIKVLLLCGIASPENIMAHVENRVKDVRLKTFPDHHMYDRYDLEQLREIYEYMGEGKKIVLTTEKDAMRLHLHRQWLTENKIPIFSLPIEVDFFEPDKQIFNSLVLEYVDRNRK